MFYCRKGGVSVSLNLGGGTSIQVAGETIHMTDKTALDLAAAIDDVFAQQEEAELVESERE